MTTPAMPGTPVQIPVPPDLFRALGSHSSARYAVFWYDADDDDMTWTDGVSSGNAQPWTFKEFLRHRAVEPLLRPFDLTSPRSELVLVFDQEHCRASIATGDQAADFLRQHRPPLPPTPPMTEEPGSLVEQITTGWEEVPVDQEAVRKAMAEQRGRVGRMVSWLEMAPAPPEQRGKR